MRFSGLAERATAAARARGKEGHLADNGRPSLRCDTEERERERENKRISVCAYIQRVRWRKRECEERERESVKRETSTAFFLSLSLQREMRNPYTHTHTRTFIHLDATPHSSNDTQRLSCGRFFMYRICCFCRLSLSSQSLPHTHTHTVSRGTLYEHTHAHTHTHTHTPFTHTVLDWPSIGACSSSQQSFFLFAPFSLVSFSSLSPLSLPLPLSLHTHTHTNTHTHTLFALLRSLPLLFIVSTLSFSWTPNYDAALLRLLPPPSLNTYCAPASARLSHIQTHTHPTQHTHTFIRRPAPLTSAFLHTGRGSRRASRGRSGRRLPTPGTHASLARLWRRSGARGCDRGLDGGSRAEGSAAEDRRAHTAASLAGSTEQRRLEIERECVCVCLPTLTLFNPSVPPGGGAASRPGSTRSKQDEASLLRPPIVSPSCEHRAAHHFFFHPSAPPGGQGATRGRGEGKAGRAACQSKRTRGPCSFACAQRLIHPPPLPLLCFPIFSCTSSPLYPRSGHAPPPNGRRSSCKRPGPPAAVATSA